MQSAHQLLAIEKGVYRLVTAVLVLIFLCSQPMLERGMVARIAALSRYPEETLKISALCAIKNIVDKATMEEKDAVMTQLGWDYFLE